MADDSCRVFVRRHENPETDERRKVQLKCRSVSDHAVGTTDSKPTRVDRLASDALAKQAFEQRVRDLTAAGWSECDQP